MPVCNLIKTQQGTVSFLSDAYNCSPYFCPSQYILFPHLKEKNYVYEYHGDIS